MLARYEPEPNPSAATAPNGAIVAPLVLVTKVDLQAGSGDQPPHTTVVVQAEDRSFTTTPAQLYPAGTLAGEAEQIARQLLTEHIGWLTGQLDAAQDQVAAAQPCLADLEGRVAAIRRYAIAAHRSGDICRPGLDRFLAEFDLAPYSPAFTATVTIRLHVSGHGCDDDSAIKETVEGDLEVNSGSGDISIDDWEVDQIDDDTYDCDEAD